MRGPASTGFASFREACRQGPVLMLPLGLVRRPCRLPGTVGSTRTGAVVLDGAVERPTETCQICALWVCVVTC